MRITAPALVVASVLAPSLAVAQQYSPLFIPPKPNLILAVDTSHEMALATNGSAYFLGFGPNRLTDLKLALIGSSPAYQDGVIYPFRNEFVWGGYAYSGSQFAKIKDGSGSGPFNTVNTIRTPPITPTPANIAASYASVVNMIAPLTPDYCNATKASPACTENVLPGGGTLACITPTPACAGDPPILQAVLAGGLTGFSVPSWLTSGVTPLTAITCDEAAVPGGLPTPTCDDSTPGVGPVEIRPLCELIHELTYFSYPRFNPPGIPANDVRDQLCDPLAIAFANVQAKLDACQVASPTTPDFSPSQFTCAHGPISANICNSSSPFDNTCVCNQTNPLCAGVSGPDACGVPYSFRARQQVSMCFAHNPNLTPGVSPIRSALAAQTDNVLNGGPSCRGNSIVYVTDGIAGDTAGVLLESPANFGVYRTEDPDGGGPMTPLPQNFVLELGGRPQADVMQDYAQDATVGVGMVTALDAANAGAVKATLGRAINRNLKGTYSAANIAFDRYETRAAFFLYEVPGAPNLPNEALSTYLGRPSRIAWHVVDPSTGAISGTPLWETDWSTKVGLGAQLNSTILASGPVPDPRLGPTGTWVDGVIPKDLTRPAGTLDRNGDGTVVAAEQPFAVRWGYLLGGENAQPLIIEAPRDVPAGGDTIAFAQFQQLTGVTNRPRVVLAQSNGYVVAYNAGNVTSPITSGRAIVEKAYDDAASGSAGTELFRVRPSFLYAAQNPSSVKIQDNDALQQPLMNGHMIVREVQMQATPPRFSTLLVFTQGSAGRGIAAVDISNPVPGAPPLASPAFNTVGGGPRVLWETLLPGCGDPGTNCEGTNPNDRATARPQIYTFPQPNVPGIDRGKVSVLVMTGGAGGTNNIYAYRLRDGALLTSTSLPAIPGSSYRTGVSCVDSEGRGARYCYVLAGNGSLVRVDVDPINGSFGGASIISTAAVGGGRQFWTEPVVTYGPDNSINAFFASGDINTLNRVSGVSNALYKVVDKVTATAGGGIAYASGVCRPDSFGSTSGLIRFNSNDEMVVSPPVLAKGVLSYSTYLPAANGCTDGTARVYAMNYETCSDGRTGSAALRPGPVSIGNGVPSSPSMMRRSSRIITHTSKAPTAAQAVVSQVNAKAATRIPLTRSHLLQWRIMR